MDYRCLKIYLMRGGGTRGRGQGEGEGSEGQDGGASQLPCRRPEGDRGVRERAQARPRVVVVLLRVMEGQWRSDGRTQGDGGATERERARVGARHGCHVVVVVILRSRERRGRMGCRRGDGEGEGQGGGASPCRRRCPEGDGGATERARVGRGNGEGEGQGGGTSQSPCHRHCRPEGDREVTERLQRGDREGEGQGEGLYMAVQGLQHYRKVPLTSAVPVLYSACSLCAL
ncbi:hypothetical protein OG21DRAFT_1527776 [Imleria badia]|nr:hypothetical protein OG21DRAFT_1527776 [Imleria badia]